MKKILFILTFLIVFTNINSPVFAEGIGCGEGMGPLAKLLCNKDKAKTEEVAQQSLNNLVSGLVTFLTIIGAIWFMFQFLMGAFSWISAGADKGQLEASRNRMLHAVVGFIILVAGYMFIGLVGKLLGIDILNPGKMLRQVTL